MEAWSWFWLTISLGFILGQVSLGLLIFLLFKIFLLRGSGDTRIELDKPKRIWDFTKQKGRTSGQRGGVGAGQLENLLQKRRTQMMLDGLILLKLKYDPVSHSPETCDWINVLVAQFISSFRNDPTFLDGLAHSVDNALNNEKKPGFVGPVTITEFTLGEEYPEIKNARIHLGASNHPLQQQNQQSLQSLNLDDQDLNGSDGNMRVLLDFSYDDQLTFAVDTQALVNWPKVAFASLPLSLSFTLVKFSGTVVVEFVSGMSTNSTNDAGLTPEPASSSDISLSLYILENFTLELSVASLLGHRTKVKDLPKLTSLLVGALRQAFVREFVYPNRKNFRIPRLFGEGGIVPSPPPPTHPVAIPETGATAASFKEEIGKAE